MPFAFLSCNNYLCKSWLIICQIQSINATSLFYLSINTSFVIFQVFFSFGYQILLVLSHHYLITL